MTPHIPERTCVACRKKRPQAELLRLWDSGAGWQLTQKPRQGRGIYVCPSPECWQEKKLRRAFRAAAPAVSELLQTSFMTRTQAMST